MPSASSFLAWSVLSFAVIIPPGPSVMFIVSRAVALGRRAALLTVLGNACGIYLQVLMVSVGLGALLERSITFYTVVRLAGAVYLVWLGVQAIRHRGESTLGDDAGSAEVDTRLVLREGFVVGALNPKSLAALTALLPQFVNLDGAPAGFQMAVLGAVFVGVALVADSTWGIAAGTARQWFARSPKRLGRLGAAGGTVMIALGLKLALTGRKD
jgi:threonine/homoserine/homoserine lactone efflux protein